MTLKELLDSKSNRKTITLYKAYAITEKYANEHDCLTLDTGKDLYGITPEAALMISTLYGEGREKAMQMVNDLAEKVNDEIRDVFKDMAGVIANYWGTPKITEVPEDELDKGVSSAYQVERDPSPLTSFTQSLPANGDGTPVVYMMALKFPIEELSRYPQLYHSDMVTEIEPPKANKDHIWLTILGRKYEMEIKLYHLTQYKISYMKKSGDVKITDVKLIPISTEIKGKEEK